MHGVSWVRIIRLVLVYSTIPQVDTFGFLADARRTIATAICWSRTRHIMQSLCARQAFTLQVMHVRFTRRFFPSLIVRLAHAALRIETCFHVWQQWAIIQEIPHTTDEKHRVWINLECPIVL